MPAAATARRPQEICMSTIRFWRAVAVPFASLALCTAAAHAQETFKLGIVSFLSGQAAESFGIRRSTAPRW